MTRKEKTQQNRFDKKIAPLLKELADLCDKFEMPMLAAVQLFENDEDGARVNTSATHPQAMSLPMTLSTSLMNGTTQVRISEDNQLQLIIPKKDMPEELRPFAQSEEDDLEPLVLHALHCEDCNILMQEAIARGESIDNIVVPSHDGDTLRDLIKELKKERLPFIIPKNSIVH